MISLQGQGGGPRTDAGKAVSRANALTHGATARALVPQLVGEDRYAETLEAFEHDFHPVGITERALVDQLAQISLSIDLTHAQVRGVSRALARACGAITGFGPERGKPDSDEVLKIIVGSLPFGLAMRYHAMHVNAFRRTLLSLRELQALRGTLALRQQSKAFALAPSRSERLRQLREIFMDAEARKAFLAECLSPTAALGSASSVPLEPLTDDCFLHGLKINEEAALLAAAEIIADSTASIAALRKRTGVRNRRTLQALCERIRLCGESQRDRVLVWIEEFLDTAN